MDFVEQTDWSQWGITPLLDEIERHADTMRGASVYDLSYVMEPARELARRVAELEATQRALLDRLEIQRIYAPDAEIEVQRLRAELDALKAAQQWQPVDTAPIDRPLEALLTARRSADDRWYYADVRPTAWRPLPPAPNEAEEVQP